MDLRGWGVRGVVVGAVVALVVTGCTGDPEPQVTPTPAPTLTAPVVETRPPSPTPSPSPTALTEEEILAAIPEEARHEDFLGAEAFAKFFLENYQAMMQTAPEKFEILTQSGCGFCTNVKQVYTDVESRGGTFEGGRISVQDQQVQGGLQEDGTWALVFSIEAAEMIERDADGMIVETFEGGPGKAVVSLQFDEHWTVSELSAEES